MARIPFNPYIVGNPIRTSDMFFGREDDFQYVVRKIGGAQTNQIVVFCGERRSGKTSILFQILSGRLGERFLPVLIDMQILAGIRGDDEFFRAMLRAACEAAALPGLTVEALEASLAPSARAPELLEGFLEAVEARFPDRIVLFLLDEYELIEEKIQDGTLSEAAILYLSGVLESRHRISFVFTGSTNLEDRKASFWKSLLAKSIYRKISYLSRADTLRLVTEPLRGYVSYPSAVQEAIYRLTGGQPFYTQVICQNLVDRLIEQERTVPSMEDLEIIVRDVADNPLPQMIYFWTNLEEATQLVLACLGGVLADAASYAGPRQIATFLSHARLASPFKAGEINMLLEQAYHKEILEKKDDSYRFRMDLFRRWIAREHSVWKVAHEIALELRRAPRRAPWIGALLGGLAAAGLLATWRFARTAGPVPPAPEAESPSAQPLRLQAPAAAEVPQGIVLAANRGPFRVVVDGSLALTSEGQADPRRIVLPSLAAGAHRFDFHLAAGGERVTVEALIDRSGQVVQATFATPPPAPRAQQPEQSAQEVGTLIVSSNPPGALVVLDGADSGHRTPVVLERVPVGRRTITLRMEGYRDRTLEVAVEAQRPAKAEVPLEEAFGELVFDVRPAATILLDGNPLVEAPYVKPIRVRAGRHVLAVVNEALGIRREREIYVKEGERLEIQEVLR